VCLSLLALLSSPIQGRAQSSPPGTAVSAQGSNPESTTSEGATPSLTPPSGVVASDLPNDAGHGVLVRWRLSPDDAKLMGYDIYRLPAPDSPEDKWFAVGTAPRGNVSFEYVVEEPDVGGAPNPAFIAIGRPVYLAVRARSAEGAVSPWSPVVQPARQGGEGALRPADPGDLGGR
jgi:hypothetical protein